MPENPKHLKRTLWSEKSSLIHKMAYSPGKPEMASDLGIIQAFKAGLIYKHGECMTLYHIPAPLDAMLARTWILNNDIDYVL